MDQTQGQPGSTSASQGHRLSRHPDWQTRLREVTLLMRELSQQTDPQEMVKLYRQRIGQFLPVDSFVALSRRGLTGHAVKVTRASIWDADFDPWMNQGELPVYTTGLLCDLIASGEPAYLRNITIDPSDPAYEYLGDVKLVVAVPSYDNGEALNMFVMGMHDVDAFDPRDLPDAVWRTNLFGRATNMLVLKKERDLAYEHLDSELKVVADIQRSLLPKDLPEVPGLDLADHYQTSARAGGDYYDIFPLEGGKWGFLIADVCGHGTPAAVLMAIMHALAHTYPGTITQPGDLLGYVNDKLAAHYIADGNFITAFYAIYDPAEMTLTYASAGHNPPRLKRCSDGSMFVLDEAQSIPLGIIPDTKYEQATMRLVRGDQVILYTDGITEAFNHEGDLFGTERLDEVLADCGIDAHALIESVLESIENFTEGRPADDDRTLLVLKAK
ncbi:MAG: PP2C family protein-serine/threonine phosphatase [Phycisphaerales bacterium]|nr:PP2C family protein-serine/threonine phosphatase [Phycisphaerales bacterium]